MMHDFILLTRTENKGGLDPDLIYEKSKRVQDEVASLCPDVAWVFNYALMGQWDYLDVFQAPDTETAMKVSTIVREIAGAHTEIWPAIAWGRFKEVMQELSMKASSGALPM